MIIWYDAVTSKEPLLFNAIAKELEKEGHEAIFTCRNYDYVASLFFLLDLDVEIFGKHGGGSLYGKLMAGNERITHLANYINSLEKKPDYHISFSCPESTRVAFGLGIPSITINDSPHAKAVGKLTIPLSKYLVYSSCITDDKWFSLGATRDQLEPYEGIDEVAWLQDFEPQREVLDLLGLHIDDNFIVGRTEESSAAYMLDRNMAGQTHLGDILDEIFQTYDGRAVVFPRYEEQEKMLKKKFKNRIIVPPRAVDTLSLYHYSDLCITGGATMAREAAALGTPSISYYPKPLDVLEYIAEIGIPLHNEYTIESATKKALELIEEIDQKSAMRSKTKKILSELESPTTKISTLI
jgi:predicted glycosyltransferase